ncbi:Accumulation of DYads protein [Rhizina undulata]
MSNDFKSSDDIEGSAASTVAAGNGNLLNRALNNGADLQPAAAYGGEFYPGLRKPNFRKFGNPSPLGLCAFSITWFVLSHTFGATALTSYGGFWLSWAMMETSQFGIAAAYSTDITALNNALGFYLIAWFIFTTIILLCTLKSTVALFSMFLMLDLTFLLLAISRLQAVDGNYQVGSHKAASITGCITAFLAWWNVLAGLVEQSNFFFTIPVFHFPWSEKAKFEKKNRTE